MEGVGGGAREKEGDREKERERERGREKERGRERERESERERERARERGWTYQPQEDPLHGLHPLVVFARGRGGHTGPGFAHQAF